MLALIAGTLPARTLHTVLRAAGRLLWGAGCALFLLLLSSLFGAAAVPIPAAALLVFVVFAAWRPALAIVALPAVIPIAGWAGRQWIGGVAWPETVAVAYLAGYSARKALGWERGPVDPLAYAIFGMMAVVVGSLAVELLVLHATLGGESWRGLLWQLVSRDFFIGNGGFEQTDAAMRFIEGLLLAHAAATCARASPAVALRLVRALAAGAAIAGALNLWRLWLGAIRLDDPVLAFLRYLGTLRFNTHYADVNAAGSYYVMALLPAIALTVGRLPWVVAAILIGLSLALTGSRAAFVAGVVALALVWLRTSRRTTIPETARHRRWLRPATIALIVLVSAGMFYAASTRNVTPIGRALEFRKEFTLTSLRMFASRPVFGVGIGDYREASAEFSSPKLRAVYPNENAHNNFLQVLAEVGAIGFVIFVALLTFAATRTGTLLSSASPLVAAGSVAGLLAFLLTCVAGHPLLIDEPALTFWLLLGTVAGWGSSADREWSPSSSARWVAVLLLLVVAISIPTRAERKFGSANLEHLGIGVSSWQMGPDDVRYRTAGARSTVFVPATASVVTVRVRALPPATSLEVQLYLDGRHANSVSVTSDMWRVIHLPIPHRQDGPRFRALQMTVSGGAPADHPLLMIGKVEPH